jgi:very-short-patch-repair endonuclease
MHKRTTPKTFRNAQELRHNTTPAEVKLWTYLRRHQIKDIRFRRQHAIGNYVVDFCAPRQKLVIELDGSHHFDRVAYDEARSEFLRVKGYRVMRFFNNDVMNDIEGVVEIIMEAIE